MGILDWLSNSEQERYFIAAGQKYTLREFGFAIFRLSADFSGSTIQRAIIDNPEIKQINGGEFLSSHPYFAHLYLTAYFTTIYKKYISDMSNIKSSDLTELDVGISDSIKTIIRPDGSKITDSEVDSVIKVITSFKNPLDNDMEDRNNSEADVFKSWSACTEKYVGILRNSYNENNEDVNNLFPSYSPALLAFASILDNAPYVIFTNLKDELAVKLQTS